MFKKASLLSLIFTLLFSIGILPTTFLHTANAQSETIIIEDRGVRYPSLQNTGYGISVGSLARPSLPTTSPLSTQINTSKPTSTGTTSTPRYIPKDANGNALPLPKRAGGELVNGTSHVPESMEPHTQIGTQKGRKGDYTQTLEWGKNGIPVKRTDWTDHGRKDHTNPHTHYPVLKNGSLKFEK